jgi:CDP-4-dehydro-6-deoxyglucose reductase, E3
MAYVQVGNKGSFAVDADETILEAGLRAGFGFPKACRNGNCERCAGRLLNGSVTLAKHGAVLHAGEPGSDRVLYCIATANTDCEIDAFMITAPGELPVVTVRCQVVAIRPLNHNVSAVTLRLPAGQKVHWHAGQYLLLGEKQDAAFSIANAAQPGSRDLHLHIRHDNDNQSAVELMEELPQQATTLVTLPLGGRYIDTAPAQPVWFICGSTGFAPARAMIERLAQLRFTLPVRLFRGGRRSADIYPPDWRAGSLDALTDFREVIAVNEAPAATQFHGMVHEAALAALQDPSAPLFHVGGSPAMAWAVFDALVAAGVPAAQIHSDVFDYAPRDNSAR